MQSKPAPSIAARVVATLAVCGVALWAVWPWRLILHTFPWRIDAGKWIDRGLLSNPTWTSWVFFDKHFVGYRPVAALSYTLNQAVLGWEAWTWRSVDLGLHAGVVLCVAALHRQLGGRLATAAVAALIFAAHPANEEVISYSARRSYTLAECFGLLGLLALIWAYGVVKPSVAGWAGRGWALAGALLLGLGVLSNENAYVLVPVALIVGLWSMWRGLVGVKEGVLRTVPLALVSLGAVLARYLVLGTLGGYQLWYIAYASNGHKAWTKLEEPEVLRPFAAAWDYLVLPVGAHGQDAVALLGDAGGWGAAIALLVLLVVGRAEGGKRARALLGLSMVWIFGYALLYGLTATWFWRQGYPMVVPYALIMALVADQVLDGEQALWRRVGLVLSGALLMVPLWWWSPLVRGIDTREIRPRIEGTAVIEAMRPLIAAAPRPGVVAVALPLEKSASRDATQWLIRLEGRPDLEVRVFERAVISAQRFELGEPVMAGEVPRWAFGRGSMLSEQLGRALGEPGSSVRIRRFARDMWNDNITVVYPLSSGEIVSYHVAPRPRRPVQAPKEGEVETLPPEAEELDIPLEGGFVPKTEGRKVPKKGRGRERTKGIADPFEGWPPEEDFDEELEEDLEEPG